MNYNLRFKESVLSYKKSGKGDRVLILFHGFGQQHHSFATLSEMLSEHYTLYAFDLFFHGDSHWNEGEQPLEKDMWKEIVSGFLQTHSIERFSLLGYSLGGKFVLATLESFPERIEQIFLLAPDGIKSSFWYTLATYPVLLRLFFKSMILKPGRLQFIISLLQILHIVDNGLLRFVQSQMDTQHKRERVYYSWVVFRHLKFAMRKIAFLINGNSIGLTVIVGGHDKIIKAKNMQHLLRHVPNHQFEILDTGHNGVITKSIPALMRLASQ